jgi:tetratricopeptide (TPR) repeat protein
MKLTVAFLLITLAAACGPAPKKIVEVRVAEDEVVLTRAGSLAGEGHYAAFKKALGLYRTLYAKRALRPKVAAAYARTGLLLAMREKQVGLDSPATLDEVRGIIGENAFLSAYEDAAVLIARLSVRSRGVQSDISTEGWDKAGADRRAAAEERLRARASSDELSAAVLAAWSCSLGRHSERWPDPREMLASFPASLLVKYEVAICGQEDRELLSEILSAEPEFAEAHFHLGEAALTERKLLEAEEHLLVALKAIPESPQPPILLAGIAFATEEFDRSLPFYERAIELSPEYRDALLGKSICLAYLGRFDESMKTLERILELGFWLIGESHYWLAWNLHELGRDTEAIEHIDEAKKRLPTNSHVFGLAGTLALDAGDLDRAEKDYLESLVYDPANTESLFGMGTVLTKKADWTRAAGFFDKAGRAYEGEAAALEALIEDIRGSAMSPERKSRLLARRNSQLERVRLAGATSDYSAAAAFFNAGDPSAARRSAERAAGHPALKEKAEELLRSIKR